MKKAGKVFGYSVLGLVALGGAALLSINLFLRSPGMKERVSAAVKRRTALTCTFDAISYLPFFGLKLSHFTVPQEAEIAPLTEAPFFHADAMVANVSLWSLFRRPIKLHEVRCVRPTIVSVQLDNGSMALPWPARPVVPPPEIALNTPVIIPDAESTIEVDPIITSSIPSPAATVEEPDTSQAVVETPETIISNKSLSSMPSVQEPSPEPVLPKPPTPSKSVKRIMPQVLWIQRARVIEGRLVLLASDGKRQMLEFQNIAMNLGFDQPWQRGHALPQPTGQLSIQEIHALKMLRVDSLESSIEFKDNQMLMPDIHAVSDGGTMEGKFALGLAGRGLPFKGALVLKDVGLREVVKRVTSRLELSSGSLQGQMVGQGLLGEPATWRGVGKVFALNAKVSRHGLLESFGRHLGVQEFVQIAFETAETEFELRGPALIFRDIHLKTDNLEFKGLGAIAMNQRLQLRSRLYFSERMKQVLQRIERQLPDRINRDFDQLEGRDDYYRDFEINGTISSPRADFIGTQERTLDEMLELLQQQQKDDGV